MVLRLLFFCDYSVPRRLVFFLLFFPFFVALQLRLFFRFISIACDKSETTPTPRSYRSLYDNCLDCWHFFIPPKSRNTRCRWTRVSVDDTIRISIYERATSYSLRILFSFFLLGSIRSTPASSDRSFVIHSIYAFVSIFLLRDNLNPKLKPKPFYDLWRQVIMTHDLRWMAFFLFFSFVFSFLFSFYSFRTVFLSPDFAKILTTNENCICWRLRVGYDWSILHEKRGFIIFLLFVFFILGLVFFLISFLTLGNNSTYGILFG